MKHGDTIQREVMCTHSHMIRESIGAPVIFFIRLWHCWSSVDGNVNAEHCLDTLKGILCGQALTLKGLYTVRNVQHSYTDHFVLNSSPAATTVGLFSQSPLALCFRHVALKFSRERSCKRHLDQ